ncbi:MAG: type II toxin-antitoxin system RelE/ParE family toxin [Desulfuromonadales bacterium]|nr:type II toxin-antitoxin system RelE/ParE family toxin [Desulfuromonadales bacterium]
MAISKKQRPIGDGHSLDSTRRISPFDNGGIFDFDAIALCNGSESQPSVTKLCSTTLKLMAKYKLVFKESVAKGLKSFPGKDVVRILERIDALQHNPRPVGSEKLSGQKRYRLRQGVYRILYEVSDECLIVTVVKVGHRRYLPGIVS